MNLRGITFGIVSLLIMISCVNEQPKKDVKEKTNTESRTEKARATTEQYVPQFEVNFPLIKASTQKTETIDSAAGNVLVTKWFKQGNDENGPFIYFVTHNVLPESEKEQLKKEPASLNNILQRSLRASGTKLGGSGFDFQNIDYNTYNGMESTCQIFNGEGIVKTRIYLIGDNLFMVGAGGKNINLESVDSFINSFKLK